MWNQGRSYIRGRFGQPRLRPFGLLLAALAGLYGCANPVAPSELDLSLSRSTDAGLYRVEVRPAVSSIQINRIHDWTVQVRNADGSPLVEAVLRIDGGMPQHGHGLPTSPRVTAHLGGGGYLVEGMKFNMTGWWVLTVHVQATAGADRVTFNLIL
jgi:hypothetical protein